MNKKELSAKLIKTKVPKDAYSLDGGLPNEMYCLDYLIGKKKWQVYYSERGVKTGLKEFESEDEACNYFYDSLIDTLKSMKII
ncbi:MAG: hypothetical protein E6356_10365 [Terrisporobacter othiniensis]|uniref:hypothetical protein n=1 Tax=Terrisporobacter petrolearius TaxID=1460447 RepID=UPI0022E11510|nr:hypothetical protein [Terrisporobacter petrolearius]MDU4860892.1 hypothetical protein [Terrisporobacter othiniensis]MDU6995248.1 hypothetical protein [Terrisporobacter othiniensis]